MAKLEKVFQTKADDLSYCNELNVTCDYNDTLQSINDLEVFAYSQRKSTLIDITEIFEDVPELSKMIDSIDWREIYRAYMEAKKEEVYND